MSIFTRSKPRGETRYNIGAYFQDKYAPTASGQVVTIDSAMRSAAVAACVRALTSTVAMLPVDAVRESGSARQVVRPTPQIVSRPSARVRRRAWVAQNMRGMLTAGNAYGIVTALDGNNRPAQIETLHSNDVHWRLVEGDVAPYVKGVRKEIFPLGDLVHIPASAFMSPGARYAQSPVELAKQAIGTGLAAEEFGARFFGDGAYPSAVINADVPLTEDQASRVKAAFVNAVRGNREPAVLGSGLKYEQVSINPSDSQFIDLMRFEVEQACRFFGVPPSMVYAAVSGQNITYANITHNDLHYLKYSVGLWLADLEDAWSEFLRDGEVVKFNVDALLRMDTKARADVHEIALRNKWRTINEVRDLEDEPRFDGAEYDAPGIPGTERSLSAAEAVQKVYLGVGSVLTADEAREIINEAGADLKVPGPDLSPKQLALPIP